MMALRRALGRMRIVALLRGEEGAVLAEALIAIPFVTLFAVAILEFGNIFWERLQIENGLRDAGRYLARCYQGSGTYTAVCDAGIARAIAFYGTLDVPGDIPRRVPGWGPPASTTSITALEADTTIKVSGPDLTQSAPTITLSTSHVYESSPLFGWLGLDAIRINSYHEERYSGW